MLEPQGAAVSDPSRASSATHVRASSKGVDSMAKVAVHAAESMMNGRSNWYRVSFSSRIWADTTPARVSEPAGSAATDGDGAPATAQLAL